VAGTGLVGGQTVRTQFVVVGAGLSGLGTAWALTRRGHQVVVLDQAPVGHTQGGSHGTCRIFRLGYENPAYVTLAGQARQVWTELEETSGERLLHPTPQLTFGPQMGEVQDAMTAAGAACELLSAGAARERFPGLTVPGPVLLEPESAVISADRALAALSGQLSRAGQPVGWPGDGDPVAVTGIAEHGRGVRVSTARGDVDADRVIVCAGPWTGSLVGPAGIMVPGSASMEQVGYLAPAVNEEAGAWSAQAQPTPIFIHYGGDSPYGLPVPGMSRYKIGIHGGGPPVAPRQQDHTEHAGLSRQIERAAREFLPGFDPVPVAFERCIYDNSPDTDFIIDRIGNVVIGCGTSGHGFKFGPLIGEWLAELATGDRDAARPGNSDARAIPPAWLALSRW
jgi:sarcosine oxidase